MTLNPRRLSNLMLTIILLLLFHFTLPPGTLSFQSILNENFNMDQTNHLPSVDSLKVATFNIRYDPLVSIDKASPRTQELQTMTKVPAGVERPWIERKQSLVDQVLWESPDIVGFQEVLDRQYKDLIDLMGFDYDHVGVGRDDGKKAGEAVPIFFKKNTFELIKVQHFWLSLEPDVPGSIGWDANQTRMVTVAQLRLRSSPSGETVIVANTHFDHRGLIARNESSKLILKLLLKHFHDHQLVILVGDLNSPPTEDGYKTLTGHRYVSTLPDSDFDDQAGTTFIDCRNELPFERKPYGEHFTFTGFEGQKDLPEVIDFILLADNVPDWRVARYGVMPNQFEFGPRFSDHRLVVATIVRSTKSFGK